MPVSPPVIVLTKANPATSFWAPFEEGSITIAGGTGSWRVQVQDASRRVYWEGPVRAGRKLGFAARGSAGTHSVEAFDGKGRSVAAASFRLAARTAFSCDRGPYAQLAERIAMLLTQNAEQLPLEIGGRLYRMLVPWGRDHVHTLKAAKYFLADVQSGLDYWLESQEPDGMFWDCIHRNDCDPAPTWFADALGPRFHRYDDGMKWAVRRIPVEADCEFLYTEGVWQAWKASGDDAWMARQLPRLEAALRYNNSHPNRWSPRHGLVRRSMCMDSWDFVNPLYCHGDHRCINPGDPQFLFHGDNSGLYSSYWRMAEMYEALGQNQRAAELRAEGEALRQRANAKLFFGKVYGHMIPEELPEAEVYAKVGDERRRMSLSTGYTINRGLPTHEMALKIIREYRRRGHRKLAESFAEWWTMDPPYQPQQWPVAGTGGSTVGEYMNGAICTIIAGELAKAACEHGEEAYAADILERVWQLSQRDGGELYQVYRRLPEHPVLPQARFEFVNLRAVVNRGLKNGARRGVVAWTGEGDNDLRGLPVGRQRFGAIDFDVIDPRRNRGLAVLRLDADGKDGATEATVTVPGLLARSLYFLHATPRGTPRHAVVGSYELLYADGSSERLYVRAGHEIGHWWGANDAAAAVDRSITRLAWRGSNPTWENVGLYMGGWNQPRPDQPIVGLRLTALPAGQGRGGIMLAGISLSDQPVGFEPRIRSHGLPDCWSQAAVFYAVAEGLAGIADHGRAFDRVQVAPRWAASQADKAEVTLHYPASDGYCSYRYHHDRRRRRLTLDLTGSLTAAQVHLLLPAGVKPVQVEVDGVALPFATVRVERSLYVDFALTALPRGPIVIEYRTTR